jgi:hypothetical protein
MLLFIFGIDGDGLVDGSSKNGSHPHPYLRSLLVLHRGLYSSRDIDAVSERTYSDGTRKAIDDLPAIWNGLMGANFSLRYIDDGPVLQQEWSLLMNRIKPHFQELRTASDRRWSGFGKNE